MKKVFSVIGVIILILLIVPATLPSKFSMSRSIVIDAPVANVFTKLTDLNEYTKWNPFAEGDIENKYEVNGAGVGGYLEWKGGKAGDGRMTFTSIEPSQKIAIKMDFYKPMPGHGMVNWLTNSKSETQTEFIWTFEQDLSYFMRYFGLIMDSMMGKHFEKGLANYKTLMESAK